MSYKVRKFECNGFYGGDYPELTNYTAEFVELTNDPGIGIFNCSDGEKRLIPIYAIEGDLNILPKQLYKDGKPTMFGCASHS